MKNNCKIILMDDVHLEGRPVDMCQQFASKIVKKITEVKLQGFTPIVVCAGDIGEGTTGIEWAKQFDCDVVYICGNHEYWGQDYFEEIKNVKYLVSKPGYSHIHFLHNDIIELHGIRFIGATLWTDLGQNFQWNGKNFVVRFHAAMGDFKRISAHQWYTDANIKKLNDFLSSNGLESSRIEEIIDKKMFNPLIEIEENNIARQFLFKSIGEAFNGQTVVVTHHLPFKESWIKNFRMKEEVLTRESFNDEKNFLEAAKGNVHSSKDLLMMGFYTNNLKDILLNKNAPQYWFHGHLHQPIDDLIGNTKIISSPVGYMKQSKEMSYKEIELLQHSKEIAQFVKKEIEEFQWNSELLENLRNFEKIIWQYETIISAGLATTSDFNLISNAFLQNFEYARKEVDRKTAYWLSFFTYSKHPEMMGKLSAEEIRDKSGFEQFIKRQSDKKSKKIWPLSMGINENSFLSEDKFNQVNKAGIQIYHFKQWLKELSQAQLNINMYKKTLLDFCSEYEKLN